MTNVDSPLGKVAGYPSNYAPDVLYPIARDDARGELGITTPLPFHGDDLWTAWDLCWLNANGRPCVAVANVTVPATSTYLIESKSLKLYLGSFAMTAFKRTDEVAARIKADLRRSAQGDVDVQLWMPDDVRDLRPEPLGGKCLDDLDVHCDTWDVDAGQLISDRTTEVEETVHTHLLRSLCPVTGQPDIGSLEVRYRGPTIDPESLLRYVVSYRQHCGFHEACVERIFLDLKIRCQLERLSVYARYQRRGGIDINPFRSDFDESPINKRLFRQ